MVKLTAAAAVRISPVICKGDDLLAGRGYGRKALPDNKVPFKEVTPLALKNIVSLQSSKHGEKACLNQMMDVIACLSKFDQNQSMCAKEITTFNDCYKTFRVEYKRSKAEKLSGEIPVGRNTKLTGDQMSKYMNKFQQSARKGQFNNDATYKGMHRTGKH